GSLAHLAGDTITGFSVVDIPDYTTKTDPDADVIAITGLAAATYGKLLDSIVFTDGVLSLGKAGGGTILLEGLEGTHYTDTVLGSDGSILLYIV
ncbi:MAG: hypothetical protein AB7P02_21775, partial [Alphaproteobacteria bacterium]